MTGGTCTETLASYRALFFAYAATGAIASVVIYRALRPAFLAHEGLQQTLAVHTKFRPMMVAIVASFAAVLATAWPVCMVCWLMLRLFILGAAAATHREDVTQLDVPMDVLDKALMARQAEEIRGALRARGYESDPTDEGFECWFSGTAQPSKTFFFSERKGPLWLITYSCAERVEIVGFEEAIRLIEHD